MLAEAVMTTSKTFGVFIGRCPADVYAFASNPLNLPQWATAFCKSITQSAGIWVADTPLGSMAIRFIDRNDFGLLDHFITLPSGVEVYVPMRVIHHGGGSEVIFTLLRPPETTDAEFLEDGGMVAQDLQMLKSILEK